MAGRIEDYAIIGNCRTMALVGKDGSIDWMGVPRFDSAACFAALLGGPEHGRWLIGPAAGDCEVHRRYRDGTLVLETEFVVPGGGRAVLTDLMTRRDGITDVVRVVRGISGRVAMRMELTVRFEYGSVLPWVTRQDDGRTRFVAGPNLLVLDAGVPIEGEDFTTIADFEVAAGQSVPFTLSWRRSYREVPDPIDSEATLTRVTGAWQRWSERCHEDGPVGEIVRRSFITLKALTDHETGGIVAAGTTSLPEKIGGPRNWDYRFCWLRDSTFTLYALMRGGFTDEAAAWREWLLRAVAGAPAQMQIMYGVGGERRLDEFELEWLPGYEGSTPVRIGNAAHGQLQLDVYGEVIDAFYQARRMGIPATDNAWNIEKVLVDHLGDIWREPDDGIWEVRGPRQQFTHSKVMVWAALDRAVRSIEEFGLPGPLDRWKALRQEIHDQVCAQGYNSEVNSFVQHYGTQDADASLLLMPLVGFLPSEDPRVAGTIAHIERRLLHDGFVARYDTGRTQDGLPGDEGVFLACSFWLADNYALQGRLKEARTMFERLLALRNDVGLLSEEYDPRSKRLLGNFPQAFSHVALINTAHNLMTASGPAQERANGRKGRKHPAAGNRRVRPALNLAG